MVACHILHSLDFKHWEAVKYVYIILIWYWKLSMYVKSYCRYRRYKKKTNSEWIISYQLVMDRKRVSL